MTPKNSNRLNELRTLNIQHRTSNIFAGMLGCQDAASGPCLLLTPYCSPLKPKVPNSLTVFSLTAYVVLIPAS